MSTPAALHQRISLLHLRLQVADIIRNSEFAGAAAWAGMTHPRLANGQFAPGNGGTPIGGTGYLAHQEAHYLAQHIAAHPDSSWNGHTGIVRMSTHLAQLVREAKAGAADMTPHDIKQVRSLYRIYIARLTSSRNTSQPMNHFSRDRLDQEIESLKAYAKLKGVDLMSQNQGISKAEQDNLAAAVDLVIAREAKAAGAPPPPSNPKKP